MQCPGDNGWRYNLSDVLELLDGENLDDLGLAESEDSDCEDGEVGSYLPEVQRPYHALTSLECKPYTSIVTLESKEGGQLHASPKYPSY